MKTVLSLVTFSIFATLVSTSVAFASIDSEFDRLKDSGEDFIVIGQICESVAMHDFEKLFPAPQYELENGVAYSDAKRTIGELDVVVFDSKSKQVVSIAEVKCWKDNGGALAKARDQRQRFLSTVQRVRGLNFKSTHTKRAYSQSQFANVTDFRSVGPLGAKKAGFEIEMDYSLDELMGLRQKLMDCQQAGQCKRP